MVQTAVSGFVCVSRQSINFVFRIGCLLFLYLFNQKIAFIYNVGYMYMYI